MDSSFDHIKRLFESLKGIGFLERLFGWGKVKTQLIDASADLQRLISSNENLKSENSKLSNLQSIGQASVMGLQESNHRLNT
ncbi:MAG TPA: hypothetical protein VIT44_01425, partial [Cyclobacteriaceae bacterium]